MRQSPGAFGLTAQKIVDILQLPFIAGRRFPVVVQRPIPMVLPVEDHRNFAVAVFVWWSMFLLCRSCSLSVVAQRQVPDGRDSAEYCGVSAVVLLLDKLVDVPVLATSWGCRAHHGYDELMMRLFRAVYTGTRPGLTPAIRAGKGWRGRQELAPRCSATQSAACRHDPGQTRRVLNHLNHTHHTHHTPHHTTPHHTTPHHTTPPHTTRPTPHTHTTHHTTPHTSTHDTTPPHTTPHHTTQRTTPHHGPHN